MESKRKVKVPGRFVADEHWYIVQFTEDAEYSYPVPSGKLEDETSGENGNEEQFKVGDCCSVPWLDGKNYSGNVVFENESKEECLKFRARLTARNATKNTTKITSKNAKRKHPATDPATESKSRSKTDLAKKKKEKTESKKTVDTNRQEEAIRAAEDLFVKSIPVFQALPSTTTENTLRISPPSYHHLQTFMPTSVEQADHETEGHIITQTNIKTTSTSEEHNMTQANIQPVYTAESHNTTQANIQATHTVQSHNIAQANIQAATTVQSHNTGQANFQTTPTAQSHSITQARIPTAPTAQSPNITQASIHAAPIAQSYNITEARIQTAPTAQLPNITQASIPSAQSYNLTQANIQTAPTAQSHNTTQASIQIALITQSHNTILANIQTAPTGQSQNITQASIQTAPTAQSHNIIQASIQTAPTAQSYNMTQTDIQTAPTTQSHNMTEANIQSPRTPTPLHVTPKRTHANIQFPITPGAQTPNLTQASIQSPKTSTPLHVTPKRAQASIGFPNTSTSVTPNISQTGYLSPIIPATLTPNREHSFALNHSAFTPTQRTMYSTSPWTASLYSSFSEEDCLIKGSPQLTRTECQRCTIKEKEIESLRQHYRCMEDQICSLRAQHARLREEYQNLQSASSKVHLQRQEEGHYYPRRGQRIDKCDYIILQDENHAIPEDYVALVPGQPMYVKTEWLNHVHATFRGKSKKVAIKNMMSGIYEPEDVQGHTATSLLATPVGRSLREYSIIKLGLDGTSLVSAINSKIGTMTRALKADRVRRSSLDLDMQ